MPKQNVDRRAAEGMTRPTFVAPIYRVKVRHGRYLLHDLPNYATSLRPAPIQHVLGHPIRLAHVLHLMPLWCNDHMIRQANWTGIEANFVYAQLCPGVAQTFEAVQGGHTTYSSRRVQPYKCICYLPAALFKAILLGTADTTHSDSTAKLMTEDGHGAPLSR